MASPWPAGHCCPIPWLGRQCPQHHALLPSERPVELAPGRGNLCPQRQFIQHSVSVSGRPGNRACDFLGSLARPASLYWCARAFLILSSVFLDPDSLKMASSRWQGRTALTRSGPGSAWPIGNPRGDGSGPDRCLLQPHTPL